MAIKLIVTDLDGTFLSHSETDGSLYDAQLGDGKRRGALGRAQRAGRLL